MNVDDVLCLHTFPTQAPDQRVGKALPTETGEEVNDNPGVESETSREETLTEDGEGVNMNATRR